MRWPSFITRPVLRLAAFLAGKAVVFLVVIAMSLSISMASFVSGSVASVMWNTADWLFGRTVVSAPDETRKLRQQNRSLRTEKQDLDRRNQNLQAEKRDLDRRLTQQRNVTKRAARRIGQRAVRATTRGIASIPLESVPVLGVTTIIASTAWDVRDTCRTLDDMDRMQRQLGIEPDGTFVRRACDLNPLQGARANQYGSMTVSECRASAEEARQQVFEIARKTRDEVPDLVETWDGFDDDVRQAAAAEFEGINDICDCIADLVCDPEKLIDP
jgi:hypothetical protein